MENVNIDETKVGKFLYEVVKMAMVSGNKLHCIDLYQNAHKMELLTKEAYYYYLLTNNLNHEFKSHSEYKAIFEKIDNDLNIKHSEMDQNKIQDFFRDNREALQNEIDSISRFIRGILQNQTSPYVYYTSAPEYFFNIIDIDELRFARDQATKAGESATKATKLATNSLNWTVAGFVASVFFSVISILVSIFIPFWHSKVIQNSFPIDSKQNRVTIEPKQIDKIQEKMDDMSKQHQQKLEQQIEKLTKTLDSLQRNK